MWKRAFFLVVEYERRTFDVSHNSTEQREEKITTGKLIEMINEIWILNANSDSSISQLKCSQTAREVLPSDFHNE